MPKPALLTKPLVYVAAIAAAASVLVAQSPPSPPANLRFTTTTAPPPPTQDLGRWPMAGGTLQRTSSVAADVSSVSGVAWYRPIEAFISGSTQLITSGGRVYVATARGLVVLDAETGALVCRFDTELPVATPTVEGSTVYVPGFDRTLYALNASTCAISWTFTGAGAGFSANPLVTGGRVYVGNRDGTFYAINALSGVREWSYATGGPIMQSAAYDTGVLYFASMDMFGYALEAATGALVWRTPEKLPGEQYTTWWPVVYASYVVWAGSTAYKADASPGARDVGQNGVDFREFFGVPTASTSAGTVVSSSDGSHGWPVGSTVMSTTVGAGPYTLQGWADAFPARRVYAIVNKSEGAEPFHLPMLESGQNPQGQLHPPVSDGLALYFNGPYERSGGNIPRSRPMAWKPGTTWLRMVGRSTFAADEPLILSAAAARVFANLCCDREARAVEPAATFWSYGGNMLMDILPSQPDVNPYDPMWAFYDGEQFLERLGGYYKGNIVSRNGVYNSHGMQNPLVPHAFMSPSGQRVERMFTHRSNTVVALGSVSSKTPLGLVAINAESARPGSSLSTGGLQSRLEAEVRKMVDLYLAYGTDGFLRPAYISDSGGVSNTTAMPEPDTYFRRPADTLYTLSIAHPHVSTPLRTQLLSYLAAFWQKYFVSAQVRSIGWSSGQPREFIEYPPEVANRMAQIEDVTVGTMPQRVFYAAWKYAQLVPSQAASIYAAVRPLLVNPPPSTLDIVRGPGVYNDYIVGYQGFLNLYDMAGTNPDPALRASIATGLAGLVDTRVTNFAKDHPWEGSVDNPTGININNYVRKFNCTRNFLYMTPELGQAMRTSARATDILAALGEYTYVCPQWFVTRDHNAFQEASAHHIFDSHALFLAKAYVAAQPSSELSKWIDVPWMLGDLYHIQNLVAALGAPELPPPAGDTTPPTVSVVAPAAGALLSGTVTLSATAADNVAVAGVQFSVDGTAVGPEDVTAPYSVSWNTTAVTNGSHTVAARARDGAGNQASAVVTANVSNITGSLRITDVAAAGSVAKFDKFEVTFAVTGSVATNLQMPFDPAPPAGIQPGWGISVNAEFSDDNFQTVSSVPAFHYQLYDYQVKQNRDWFNPLDEYVWKVRFALPREGTWQYRLSATDASGSATSPPQAVTVLPSASPGFVRVSSRDRRYFEFDDGSLFNGIGYNGAVDWFNPSPVRSSLARFASMAQNGVSFSRIWLTQAAIFGSAWNPWYGLRGDYGGYVPRTGITPVGTPAEVKLRLSYAEDTSGNRNTGYFEACRFLGGFQAATAVKRNATYRVAVRYTAVDVTGPRNQAFPDYGFVLKMQNPANGAWHTTCYEPGSGNSTGLVISPYARGSSGEAVLEGTWSSGTNDFLPPLYLALENVNATNATNGRIPAVYISHVEIRERLTDGTLAGPNIAAKPSMEHHEYFEQRFSYAFDQVLELARQNGVYLKVVVLEKDEEILSWLNASGVFGAASSTNFYGSYRTITATRWLQQAWWRYLQARWGYSQNIHSWELVNEGDPANDRHYALADEFGKYMRQFAPNHHLVTTSFWHSLPATAFWKSASYPNMDYADLHAYISTSQATEFNAGAAKDAVVRARCGTNNTCFKNSMKNDAALYHTEHSLQALDRDLGKPLVRGEAGLDSVSVQVEDANLARDTSGVWLHNFLWSSVDAGAMYDLYWWQDNLRRRAGPDGSTANGLEEIYKPYRDFMLDVPLNNGNYRDVDAVVSQPSDVRVLGQKDTTNRRAHAWIQNRKHIWCAVVGGVSDCPYTWDGSRLSGTVNISGFAANASYPVQWLYFDPNGNPVDSGPTTITSDSTGNISLNLDAVPATASDAAVKIGIVR